MPGEIVIQFLFTVKLVGQAVGAELCILVGHLELPRGDDEGLLLLLVVRQVVDGLQVVAQGPAATLGPAQVLEEDHGCKHHQGQSDEAQSHRDSQGHGEGGVCLGWGGGPDVELAVGPHEADGAFADVPGVVGVTDAVVPAGPAGARVLTHAAVPAAVAQGATACVGIDAIQARATVGTGALGAVVLVHLTPRPDKPRPTAADEATAKNVTRTVYTGVVGTTADLLLTVGARETSRASASVSAMRLLAARAAIEARRVCASHGANLTVLAVEPLRTGAGVIVFQIRAAASVLAGIAVAFIGLDLAVGAAVAGLAGTGVTPLAGVGAGGPVRARLVVGAVVEVLVAEEAAPALLAIALPGFLAHTVQAAGVTDALIAEPPLPTNATYAFSRPSTVSIFIVATQQANRFRAVITLPAGQADSLAGLIAGVVAKVVVSGSAVDRTALAVVKLAANHMVAVA